jgi:23S rRNA G2069 N7-methylase RlmK/C1962 C5-methylase RlmI
VFDPPHLVRAGVDSYMRQKYGRLDETWRDDIKRGFDECMRVLKPGGTLIVKWSDCQVKVSELVKVLGADPLFGNRTRKTGHWLVYCKPEWGR